MSLRHIIPTLLAPFVAALATAQPLGMAYYDADHLYDTIPSLFYNDDDYTPQGRYDWNSERYCRKIENTAAVIDSMALPIVGLWSVENEAVVRDIATACKGDYSYIHRTLNSLDGMDFALLYYGDKFFPHYIVEGRRYLYIEGTLRRPSARFTRSPIRPIALPTDRVDTVGLLLCSDTRTAEWIVRDLRDERPGVKLIVMGRTQSLHPEVFGLRNAHQRATRRGRGNVRRRSGWEMRDRILADTALKVVAGDVFMRQFLVDEHTTYPIKTLEKDHYLGGYGYALPVYVYIE